MSARPSLIRARQHPSQSLRPSEDWFSVERRNAQLGRRTSQEGADERECVEVVRREVLVGRSRADLGKARIDLHASP